MTSTTGPNSDAPRRGFTLLELILVLVLISTVLAIAAPSLRGFARGRKLHQAARSVLALTRLASTQAVTEARVHRLSFVPREGACWLTAQYAGVFQPVPGDFGLVYELPESVGLELDMPSPDPDEPYLQFYPNGSSDPGRILLFDVGGQTLEISCQVASDRFAVVSASEGLR